MPQRHRTTTSALTALGVCLAVALGSSLAGCSALASATAQHRQVFYSTLASASGDAKVPAFIPPDATDVTIRSLAEHGQTMEFTSATPLDATLCHAATLTGRPRINSNWWPTTPPPSSGMSCTSGWQLFTLGGVTYGWTSTEFSR